MNYEVEKKPILWIVVPCYNEEEVLPITAPQFLGILNTLAGDNKISDKSRILFVNDGSTDMTWPIIMQLSREDQHYIGICQSRNRGHQNSLFAGLMEAKDCCDLTISIDCDGQDDLHAMVEMVDKYLSGAEIVYGVRSNRDTDSFFKRSTAQTFYRIMNLLGVESIYNHADYRLLSSTVLNELSDFQEVNLFLRGMIPLVGFPSETVYYIRKERIAGESHYPFSKMLSLAINGITSLSIKPIILITTLGIIVSVIGFIGILWAIGCFFLGKTVTGWASIICILCLLGGIQLLSLGIIGSYIGKMYMETKRRPRYIISKRTWKPSERQYKG